MPAPNNRLQRTVMDRVRRHEGQRATPPPPCFVAAGVIGSGAVREGRGGTIDGEMNREGKRYWP